MSSSPQTPSTTNAATSTGTDNEQHYRNGEVQEAPSFQDLFKEEFSRLLNAGCPKNEAASKALLAAQASFKERVSTSENSTATKVPDATAANSTIASTVTTATTTTASECSGNASPSPSPPLPPDSVTIAAATAATVINNGMHRVSNITPPEDDDEASYVECTKKRDIATASDNKSKQKQEKMEEEDSMLEEKAPSLPVPPVSLETIRNLLSNEMEVDEDAVDDDDDDDDDDNEQQKRKMSLDEEGNMKEAQYGLDDVGISGSHRTAAIIRSTFSSPAALNASFNPPTPMNAKDIGDDNREIENATAASSDDIYTKNVEIVMSQTGCARDKAETLLKKHNNDLVTTVLELTDESMEIVSSDKAESADGVGSKEIDLSSSSFSPSSSFATACIRDVLDIAGVHEAYKLILDSSEGVQNALLNSLETLAINMPFDASQCKSVVDIKYMLIALEYPELDDPKCTILVKNILMGLEKLPSHLRESISYWLGSMEDEERYWRYLCNIRQYMTLRLYQGAIDDARSAARALDILHKVLSSYPNIPYCEFYNDALNEDYMSAGDGMKYEIKLWRKYDLKVENKNRTENLKSFISFPFTLSPAIKADILEEDAQIQMREGYHREMQMAIFTGQRMFLPYLVLHVSREKILQDALGIIEHGYEGSDFKKPLKIIFDGEDGVDAGGVRKEFFQVITRELMDLSYGMFKYYEESRLLYLNADSFNSSQEFELVGVLLGVAIYNSIILDLKMPRCIYKKLKGVSLGMSDLEELNPSLAKGLQALLTFTGDVKATFGTTFQITYERYGEMVTVDLKENGGDIFVDESNRQEYVDSYIDYILNRSVQSQFESFNKGFQRVCGGPALDLFEASELELLICGNPVLDMDELRTGTTYEDGYEEDSLTVGMFWEVIMSYDEGEKKLFLKFITGSDRSPIDGLSKLKFVISKNGNDDTRLPSAHTCFNHLLLPEYSAIEILASKLKLAITNSEGFGLR